MLLDDVVRGSERLSQQRGDDLVRRLSAVERSYQRLDDCHGTVVGARVRPRLERMGLRDVPQTPLRSFVGVQAQMQAERHGVDCAGKIDIGR
jgi:hypothetical protein